MEDKMDRAQSQAALMLDARLAKSTLFQETNPHIHTVPSTSNPGPLGFFSFGFCCLLFMGILVSWIEGADASSVYGFAFTFAGLGQVITGLLEYQRKNTFASNAFLCYGFFWLGTALNGTMRLAGLWSASTKGNQMAYALWGCITMFFWFQTFILNAAVFALFLSLAILFFLLAAAETNPSIVKGTGVWGVIVAIISFYIGTAILFIEMYGKEILPVFTFNWTAMKKKLGPVGTKRFNPELDATNV